MKILELIKTPWSSVVGGGFQIRTNNGTYLATIIGSDKGIDKERDADICKQLITAHSQNHLFPQPPAVDGLVEALEQIIIASEFHAQEGLADYVMRYAHESTRRLAEQALANYRKEGEK